MSTKPANNTVLLNAMEQPNLTYPIIKNFSASSYQIIEGEFVLFTWDVDQADKVLLKDIEVEHKGESFLQIAHDEKIKLEAIKKGWFNKNLSEYIEITLAKPEITLDTFESVFYLHEDKISGIVCTLTNTSRFELILIKKDNVYVSPKTLTSKTNLLKEKIWSQEIPLTLQTDADVIIKAYNGNLTVSSNTILLRIKKPVIVSFSTDKTLIISGTEIYLEWEIENAKKIEIDNGIGDVTGLSCCRFLTTELQTFNLTIKVIGHFNEIVEQSIVIYVARFIHFFASNNGDCHDSLFYLNWDSEYFDSVTLYPNDITVPIRYSLYSIPPIISPIEYSLEGVLNGKVHRIKLAIIPAKIHSFRLEEQGAILNTEAHLKWDIENYQSISLYPLLDNNPGSQGTSFYVTDRIKRITLIVWGKANVALREIEITKLRAPQIIAVSVLQPSFSYTLTIPALPVSLIPIIYKISNSGKKSFNRQNLYKPPLKNGFSLIASLFKLLLPIGTITNPDSVAKRKLKTNAYEVFYGIKRIIHNYNKT